LAKGRAISQARGIVHRGKPEKSDARRTGAGLSMHQQGCGEQGEATGHYRDASRDQRISC
jgi:hypothetical protein